MNTYFDDSRHGRSREPIDVNWPPPLALIL